MTRKKLALAALFLALVVTAWFIFRPTGEKPVTYSFATVEEGPLVAAVSTSGTVQAAGSVIVGSQLSGQIMEVSVDYNSLVKEGDLLARLDPRTYEARVQQSQAQLEVAKARVAETEAQRRRADVTLADLRRDFVRRKELRSAGNLSQRDFETAQTKLATAEVDVQAAEAQLLNARAVVLQQDAALNQAQVDLERTAIRAPINGVVIQREVEPGQTVAASLNAPTMFVIAGNLTEMEVEARVDEADIGRVLLGQAVRFSVDAFPGRVFNGTVTQIQKAPREISNVVTYTVVVTAPNPDEKLLPGLTAKLDVIVGEKEKALKVPAAALRFRPRRATPEGGEPAAKPDAPRSPGSIDADGTTPARQKRGPDAGVVWVLGEDGKPKPVPVRFGLADVDWTEIVEGDVKAGDKVIVRADRSGATAPTPGGPPSRPPRGMGF